METKTTNEQIETILEQVKAISMKEFQELIQSNNDKWVKVDDVINNINYTITCQSKLKDNEKLRYILLRLNSLKRELSQSNPKAHDGNDKLSNPEMSLKRTGEEEVSQPRGLRVDSGNDTLKDEWKGRYNE